MNQKTICLIGVLFAIVCIASGGMLVAHAQDSGSTAFDFQQFSEPSEESLNLPDGESASGTVRWADNGNVLFVATEGRIYQYNAQTPYVIDSLNPDGFAALSSESRNANDFRVGNSGQSVYYSYGGSTIYQMNLGTAYDIDTNSGTNSWSGYVSVNFGTFDINESGDYIFYGDGLRANAIPLSTNWDITTANQRMLNYRGPWENEVGTIDIIDGNTLAFSEANGETISVMQTGVGLDSWDVDDESAITTERRNVGTHLSFGVYPNNERFGFESPRFDVVTSGGGQLTVDAYYFSFLNASIRNEETNELITEPINVTAYGEETGVYSLDTSDGIFNSPPISPQAYTVSVDGTGYTLRNKYVEAPENLETMYLLSNDTERVTTQFLLEDTTNTFTSDARLVIERSIEGNGNDWEEIYSDSFGIEGVAATLQEGVRYRISVENDEIRRTIGPYRATISEQVTINPDSGEIGVDSEGGWSMGASYDDDHINVRYTDPEDMTDSVSITIYERGNESNTIIEGDTYTSPEDLRTEYQVPPQYNESNWIVSLEVNRGGETTVISMQVGPTLDTVPTELDPMWRNIISVIVILTFGLAFSALNRAVGAIVLALVGGALWWVGWLAGATAGVLITAYLFIAIGYGIYTKTVA